MAKSVVKKEFIAVGTSAIRVFAGKFTVFYYNTGTTDAKFHAYIQKRFEGDTDFVDLKRITKGSQEIVEEPTEDGNEYRVAVRDSDSGTSFASAITIRIEQ